MDISVTAAVTTFRHVRPLRCRSPSMAERVRSILCCRSRARWLTIPTPANTKCRGRSACKWPRTSVISVCSPPGTRAGWWRSMRRLRFGSRPVSSSPTRASASLKSGVRPVSLPLPGKPPRNWTRRWCATWVSRKVRRASASGSSRAFSATPARSSWSASSARPVAAPTWPGRKLRATRSSTACCSTSCRPV